MTGAGHEWTVICNGAGDLTSAAARLGGKIVDQHMASLDEIFVAHASQKST
jgi:hypothetical protein